MTEENKKLILVYTILLTIIKSLKECKRRINYGEGDPKSELRELAYSLKTCETGSVDQIILTYIENISIEDGFGEYLKLEFLINTVNHCILMMQEGSEIHEIKKQLK